MIFSSTWQLCQTIWNNDDCSKQPILKCFSTLHYWHFGSNNSLFRTGSYYSHSPWSTLSIPTSHILNDSHNLFPVTMTPEMPPPFKNHCWEVFYPSLLMICNYNLLPFWQWYGIWSHDRNMALHLYLLNYWKLELYYIIPNIVMTSKIIHMYVHLFKNFRKQNSFLNCLPYDTNKRKGNTETVRQLFQGYWRLTLQVGQIL